jgi:hypothetical protein
MSLLILFIGMTVAYGLVVVTGPLTERIATWTTAHSSDWRMYAGIGAVLFIGGYLS